MRLESAFELNTYNDVKRIAADPLAISSPKEGGVLAKLEAGNPSSGEIEEDHDDDYALLMKSLERMRLKLGATSAKAEG